MRGFGLFHASRKTRQHFKRAAAAAAALAGGGYLLVVAALHVPLVPREPLPAQQAGETCSKTIATWKALEADIARATAIAQDIGSRCRLLTCPKLDCGPFIGFRGAVATLGERLSALAAAPTEAFANGERSSCGAIVAPLARQLEPGLRDAVAALDRCANHAACIVRSEERRIPARNDALTDEIATIIGRLEALGGGLSLTEGPAVGVRLDLAAYAVGDAMTATIDPGRNQCLSHDGFVGVFADSAQGALTEAPLSKAALPPGGVTRLFLEAPETPGHYLVAVMGRNSKTLPLAVAAFRVEAPQMACKGFSGRWETDRGTLMASVRNGVLRGTYRRAGAVKPGFLTGRVKGRIFEGTWTSELGTGGVRLVLLDDATRFTGTTGDKTGELDGAGLWRGRCVGDAENLVPER